MGDSRGKRGDVVTKFFEEAPGVKSMARLLAFILVLAGVVTGVVGICLGFSGTHLVAGLFIGAGVTEKVVQKFAEGKRE
jgi:hypothetical protein